MATDEKLPGEGSRTNRSPLLWVLALSGCVLGGASLVQHQFFANDRFYLVQVKDGAVNEIDRRTGRTWRIYGINKYEIKSPDDAVPMPLSLHEKIVGKHFNRDKLSIEFYNGTEWDISEVTIRVPDTPDGRLFREAHPIKPFSRGFITFDCEGDSEGIGQFGCGFVEFLGHPPNRP